MAVSELEQRFTPLVESQSQIWRPWGPAGRYGLHEEGDESDADSVQLIRPMRRTTSWSGFTTPKLRSRLEQDEAPDAEPVVEDELPGSSNGMMDECEERHHHVEYEWPSTSMIWSGSVMPAHSRISTVEGQDSRIPMYASVGQYSESQVEQAAVHCQYSSEFTDATLYPSESCGCQFSSEWTDTTTYQSESWTNSQDFGQWSQAVSPLGESDLGWASRKTARDAQDGDLPMEIESMQPSQSLPKEQTCDATYSSERSSPGRRRRENRTRHGNRPKLNADAVPVAEITTLMVQNLPYSLSREDFLAEMDNSGFFGLYNFCHLPRVFKTGKNQGFAFVNFVSQEVAGRFAKEWHGTRSRLGLTPTCKSLRVKKAEIQGLEACEKIADSKRMRRVKTGTFKPLVIGQAPEATAAVA